MIPKVSSSIRRLLLCSLAFLNVAHAFGQGTFVDTGSLTTQRYLTPFVQLQDGKVFVTGGEYFASGSYTSTSGYSALASSEIYDPSTGIWTAQASLAQARWSAAVATLIDGRVAVIGGRDANASVADKIELYDPATNTFSLAGYISGSRVGASAVTLADGRVLVAGGKNISGALIANLWLFTFSSSGVTSTTVTMSSRTMCTLTRMNDGRVLIAGGQSSNTSAVSTLEIFDPATNTVSTAVNMSTPRYAHTATLMADGRVFICGGIIDNNSLNTTTKKCDIFDPVSGAIVTYSMNTARSSHWATLLSTGKILINGAEVFDPNGATFSLTSSGMNHNRQDAAALKLADGRVLVAGGTSVPGTTILQSAELFVPTGWTTNHAPVANAGTDLIAYVGTASQGTVSLNGTGSTDPDGDALTYNWSSTYVSASVAAPTVTLPVGIHRITLTVTDTHGATATATINVAIVQGVDGAGYIQLQAQVQDLTNQLAAANAQITTLNTQIATLTSDKQALQTQLDGANAQITSLTAQIQSLQNQLTTANAKISSLTSLLQSLLTAFDQIQSATTTINSISTDKKTAINQALGN